MIEAILAFTVAAVVLTVTPGLDTALVLRTSASQGPRAAGFAVVGIALGCLVWGGIVALGLGALLAASELAFTIVKYLGAAYLLWLGAHLLLKPRRSFEGGGALAGAGSGDWSALRRGLLTNILNPKVGLFYVTFLPQFVPAGADVASFSFLLASIHVLLGLVWLGLLVAATIPMGRFLRRPAVVRTTDRLTGGIFVAFGIKLALSRQG